MLLQSLAVICTVVGVSSNPSLVLEDMKLSLNPRPIIDGEQAFIPLDAFAESQHLTAKTVVEGKLVALCGDVSCTFVHITPGDVRTVDGKAFIRVDRVAAAMNLNLNVSENAIVLTKPAHNAGAQQAELPDGATLPDLVLTDLAGKRVHLSDYLGKRLLICTWASW